MCKIIDKFPSGATKLSRTFAAASLYYNYSRSVNCFEIENEVDPHGLHGWEWQVNILFWYLIQNVPISKLI